LQVYLLGTLEWLVLADKWTVRYHMDEDPKCLKVFSIPLQDGKGSAAHYDRLAVSPNNQVLAATHGSTLQWLRAETGEVLDTAENAHDGREIFLYIKHSLWVANFVIGFLTRIQSNSVWNYKGHHCDFKRFHLVFCIYVLLVESRALMLFLCVQERLLA
jgi:hypothetical protein